MGFIIQGGLLIRSSGYLKWKYRTVQVWYLYGYQYFKVRVQYLYEYRTKYKYCTGKVRTVLRTQYMYVLGTEY